ARGLLYLPPMSKKFDATASQALTQAAFVCDLIKVRQLLAEGADPNARDEDGRPPLVSAVLGGSIGLVGLLLEAGADVNARDPRGFAPLHFAAEEQLPEMVRLLVAKGADPNLQDEDGATPLARAIFSERGQHEVAHILVQAGAKPDLANKAGETPRAMAARLGSGAFTSN
ncbi:MAG TPA: ankyrin repeat domain-containing protein, partial [Polyangia bacterium]|nr:ankyrin repeat domain-containing protein [Polyangia bacterium]